MPRSVRPTARKRDFLLYRKSSAYQARKLVHTVLYTKSQINLIVLEKSDTGVRPGVRFNTARNETDTGNLLFAGSSILEEQSKNNFCQVL